MAGKPDSPRLTLMLARYEENLGNWNDALDLYAEIDDPIAWFAQARIFYIINKPDLALEFIDRLIESDVYVDEALGSEPGYTHARATGTRRSKTPRFWWEDTQRIPSSGCFWPI